MKFAELKAGDLLIADGGFTCLSEGGVYKVYTARHGGFAVQCNGDPHGDCDHLLDGQQDSDGNLIGLQASRQEP